MNKESEILDGGIGVGHSIVDSPASSLRRTTSALLTSIKHRYDEDDVCIDCGYDESERYMQPQRNTNPTRMMLRSAERKGYENAIRDAIEAVKEVPSAWEHPEYPNVSDIDRNVTIAAIENLKG